MRRIVVLLTCSALIAPVQSSISHANAQQANSQAISLDSEIRLGRLPNGFTYYIRSNSAPAGRIETRLVVKGGTSIQDPDQTEYAHLVEHIVANQVAGDRVTIWDWVPSWGGVAGRDFNAFTREDRTDYKLSLPSDRPGLLRDALEIERGWAEGVRPDTQSTDKERKAVLAEILRTQDLAARLMDQYMPSISPDYSSWDQRRASIERTDNEPVLRYSRDWYRPDMQAIVVVGDIDPQVVEAMIRATFSKLTPAKAARTPIARQAPLQIRDRFRVISDPKANELQLRFLTKRRTVEATSHESIRAEVVGLLADRMIRERELAVLDQYKSPLLRSSTESFLTTTSARYPGKITAVASTLTLRPDRVMEGVNSMLDIRRSIIAYGFSGAELEDARRDVTKQLVDDQVGRKTPSSTIADRIADLFVTGRPVPSQADELRLYRDLLGKISLAEVNRSVRQWFAATDREMILVVPASSMGMPPSEAAIRRWISDAERRPAKRHKPRQPVASLKTNMVAPAYSGSPQIERFEALGMTKIYIPENDVTILLKPDFDRSTSDPRGGQINIIATRPTGTEALKGDSYLNAGRGAGFAYGGGTRGLSVFDMARLRSGRGVWTSPSLDDDETQIMGGAPPPELETLLQLFTGHFGKAQRSREVFENFLDEYRPWLSRSANIEPKQALAKAIDAKILRASADHPSLTSENLDRVDYEKALAHYEAATANAAEFLFVVTGRYDPEEITPLVLRYLSQLPSKKATQIFQQQVALRFRDGPMSETIYSGSGENASVVLMYTGLSSLTYRDDDKLRALDQILQKRLQNRLREKENGTYAVQFSTSIRSGSGEYQVRIDFDCKDIDVERMIRAALEEIDRFQKEGPSATELAGTRELEATHLKRRDREIYFWPSYLTAAFFREKGASKAFEPDSGANVKAEDIGRLARDMLQRDELKRFVVLPKSESEK